MCNFCKRMKDADMFAKHIAGTVSLAEKKGFKMTMFLRNHIEIKDDKEVSSDNQESIAYIRAQHWNDDVREEKNRIAVQIYFCPFCGEKL